MRAISVTCRLACRPDCRRRRRPGSVAPWPVRLCHRARHLNQQPPDEVAPAARVAPSRAVCRRRNRCSVHGLRRCVRRAAAESAGALRVGDLWVEARVKGGKASQSETLALAEQIVAVRRRLSDPLALARSLHNLGLAYEERGESTPGHRRPPARRRPRALGSERT